MKLFCGIILEEIANKYLLDQRKKQLIFLPGILLYPIKLFFLKLNSLINIFIIKLSMMNTAKRKKLTKN